MAKEKKSKLNKRDFIALVVRRSGICRATVEQVLPAFIDEIRYQLSEGKLFVAIESFGTFAVKELPLRQHLYTYKGRQELRTLPPKRVVKFAPVRSFTREVQEGRFDPEFRSFVHNIKNPHIRSRSSLKYKPRTTPIHCSSKAILGDGSGKREEGRGKEDDA